MSKYPYLHSAEPLLGALVGRPEFGVCPHDGTRFMSICYNVSERDTFNDPIRRELRGVMIHADTNEIVLRPFHKFFGIGERPETQVDVVRALYPERKQGYCIEHKADGMMVHAGLYHDELVVATKRTLLKDPYYKRLDAVVRSISAYYGKVTAMFERVYQHLEIDHQHLLEYPEDHFVLLAIRDNVTGDYLDVYDWEEQSGLGLQVETGEIRLKDFDVFKDFDALLVDQATRQNHEGWVLFAGGEFYKLKTDWYIKRHHIVGNLSERSIAKLVLAENIDDAMAYLSNRFASTPVLEMAQFAATKVATDYNLWLATLDALVKRYEGMEMRDIVKEVDKKDLFLLNKRRKGETFDWAAQYFKEFRQRYSCDLFFKLEQD